MIPDPSTCIDQNMYRTCHSNAILFEPTATTWAVEIRFPATTTYTNTAMWAVQDNPFIFDSTRECHRHAVKYGNTICSTLSTEHCIEGRYSACMAHLFVERLWSWYECLGTRASTLVRAWDYDTAQDVRWLLLHLTRVRCTTGHVMEMQCGCKAA